MLTSRAFFNSDRTMMEVVMLKLLTIVICIFHRIISMTLRSG